MKFLRAKALSTRQKRAIAGYLFISPLVVGVFLLFGPAIVNSIKYSLSQTDGQFQFYFIAWDNYKRMLFVEPTFIREIVETFQSLFSNTIVILLYSLFVATILNRNLKGKGFLRAMLFLPVIISTGIVERIQATEEIALMSMSSSIEGQGLLSGLSLEQFVASLKFSEDLTGVVISAIENIYGIINRSGVQIVIFLAGLQSISSSLYESARVEGASAWESFWKITIPMISPLIVVNAVYTIIDSFTSAENVVMERVFRYITVQINYGYASAAAWIYFIIIILVLAIVIPLISRFAFYENR